MASQNHVVMLVSRSKTGFIKEFEEAGLSVNHYTSVSEARESLARDGLPNGVVVLLEGIEEEGLEFCQELTIYAGLPVVVIGASDSDPSTITAAMDYSDNYLREKELSKQELPLRVQKLFERANTFAYAVGREIKLASDVMVNLIDKTLYIKGQKIVLTPTEISLLHVLLAHHGAMVDSQTLIDRVWRGAEEGNANALRVHMHRLRRKLGWQKRNQSLIKTVRGIGYMLQA
jgi:two-component system, OmpR family, response regulator